MSHYSVCVVIPQDRVMAPVSAESIDAYLENILAPFDEQTEDVRYLEFVDVTESARKSYEKDTIDVVEFSDGSRCSIYDHKFTERFTVSEGVIYEVMKSGTDVEKIRSKKTHTMKLIKDHPISQLYTFDDYCKEFCGYRKNAAGRWGYLSNPNAKWDWYQIGGRFSGEFLVKADNAECIFMDVRELGGMEPPKGYMFANMARKRDICWADERARRIRGAEESYERHVAAFETGDTSELGFFAKISEEGIHGWGTMRYIKGETLDEFKARKGFSDSDQYAYNVYAFLDADGVWHSSGDMGWFGVSINDKPERIWNDELQALMAKVRDDDFIVIVDCHI